LVTHNAHGIFLLILSNSDYYGKCLQSVL